MSLLRQQKRVKAWTLMHPRRLQSLQVMLRPLMPRSQPFLLSPFRLFPLMRAPRTSRLLLLSSPRKRPRLSQRNRPSRLAPVLFLFFCCYFFFFNYYLKHWDCYNEVLLNEWNFPFSFYITCLLLLSSLLIWISCLIGWLSQWVKMIKYMPRL